MGTRLNRRQILQGTAIGAAAWKQGGKPLAGASSSVRFPSEIRVAIIGLEGHYSEILEAIDLIPQVKITAIAEQSEDLLRRVPGDARLKDARLYADHVKLLEQEKLDLAAVCGQNVTRAKIVQDCAVHKIPIVAEKPLATTLEDLLQTRGTVQMAGSPLTMLLPMRLSPQYQAMRAIVKQGQIGEVISMGAQKSYKLGERPDWMKRHSTYGGTIPYIGIHMVDLMRYVGAREFTEVAAFQSNVGFPDYGEMENNAAMVFRLDNRGTASLRLDYLRPATAPTHGDDRLRIAGTKGVVEYQEGRGVTLITSEQEPMLITDLPPARLLVVDFLESLYGGPAHVIPVEDVYTVTSTVLRAREAAETGRVVRV